MNKYVTMLKTEIKLSFRGMDMVIFALCLPVVVVVLLGIIYGNQPAFEGASYSFLESSPLEQFPRLRSVPVALWDSRW